MSARQPRFEIVQGDAGWWARFRAANGRVVFTSEVYKRRRGAERAIELVWGFVFEVREIDVRGPR